MQKKAHPKRSHRGNGFEEWGGYMSAKKSKLDLQFEKQTPLEIAVNQTTSKIFAGVSIYVNGYTKPSADELKRLMMLHGGTYHYYYTSHTTHMIASNLPESKKKSLKIDKVVTPEWITDSIQAGKLLPYVNYLLYAPEITSNQRQLDFKQNVQPSSLTLNQCMPTSSSFGKVQESVIDSTSSYTDASMLNVSLAIPNTSNVGANVTAFDKIDSVSKSVAACSSSNQGDDFLLKTRNTAAMKAGNPDFISEFYNHSRLHHISTAGQNLKQYVQQLALENKGKPFPGRNELISLRKSTSSYVPHSKSGKVIMHLDMDCFFVSVGLRKHPELRGHPVAVTHSKGRAPQPREGSNIEYEINYYTKQRLEKFSTHDVLDEYDNEQLFHEKSTETPLNRGNYGSLSEIASCNYEARQAGLWNGMMLGKALKLCPGLKTIPYDFEAYTEVSKQLYDIVTSFTLDIEAVSCDELYIDCTEVLCDTGISPLEFASFLRNKIYEKTCCTASAGLGSNMLLARLATRVAKPNGQYLVDDSEVMEFVQKQKVEDLPGVGYSTTMKLEQFGVSTCGDLQKWSLDKLQHEFGTKKGKTLYDHCRGQDDKVVTLEKDRKSVSAEINYGIRFEKESDIYDFISELALEVQQRLKNIAKKGRSVTLKLMVRKQDAPKETAKFLGHGVCDSFSKSTLLKIATNDSKVIAEECHAIAHALKIQPQDYRGVGIHIGKLESAEPNLKSVKTMYSFLSKCDSLSPGKFQNTTTEKTTGDKQLSEASTSNSPQKDCTIKKFCSKSSVLNRTSPSPAYSDIALEELDLSVLNALPEDLRQEVFSACTTKQKTPASSASPLKSISNTNKELPKPKKAKSVKSGLQNISSYLMETHASTENNGSSFVNQGSHSSTKASLGGAVHIDEVRDLLKEWVENTQSPAEEDVVQFKNYMFQLIEENLEKTDLILKYFYRITSSASEMWRECYLILLSYVQQKMLQEFGYMLKAKSDFATT